RGSRGQSRQIFPACPRMRGPPIAMYSPCACFPMSMPYSPPAGRRGAGTQPGGNSEPRIGWGPRPVPKGRRGRDAGLGPRDSGYPPKGSARLLRAPEEPDLLLRKHEGGVLGDGLLGAAGAALTSITTQRSVRRDALWLVPLPRVLAPLADTQVRA